MLTELQPNSRTFATSSGAQHRACWPIDITRCPLCRGQLRVIGDITDPDLIRKILDHLNSRAPPRQPPRAARRTRTHPTCSPNADKHTATGPPAPANNLLPETPYPASGYGYIQRAPFARFVPSTQSPTSRAELSPNTHTSPDRGIDPLKQLSSEWRDHAEVTKPFDWKWYYAFQQVGDQTAEPLSQALRNGRARRDDLMGWLSLLSPPLLVERVLTRAAGTDVRQHQRYLGCVREFHTQLRHFFYPYLFGTKAFSLASLEQLPTYAPCSD